MSKPIVIKYGGSLLEDPGHRSEFLKQVAEISKREKVVLVHGGGKEITRQMEKAGLQARFVNGRRFTDEATMVVVKEALRGLNKEIVDELASYGAKAAGLCGQDKHMLEASVVPELGRVGLPRMVDTEVLGEMINAEAFPVFYSVAEDLTHKPLNINADDFALALAVASRARQLVFLTDSGGILGPDSKLIRTISPGDVDRLLKSNIITGGMIVKAQACVRALQEGVGRVDIVKNIQHIADPDHSPEGTIFLHAPERRN